MDQLIKVEYNSIKGSSIDIPNDLSIGMNKRVGALMVFVENAISHLTKIGIKDMSFFVQVDDEDPGVKCFKFDLEAKGKEGNILIPDPYAIGTNGYQDLAIQFRNLPTWEDRIRMAIWRGSTTGIKELSIDSIIDLPRYKLCEHTIIKPEAIDARFSAIVQTKNGSPKQNLELYLYKNDLLRSRVDPFDIALHKWIIDIDGNVNSWGLLWKLLSGSCVLRIESNRKQWYHHLLEPWHNFVPISKSMGDLKEKIDWCFNNERKCSDIANKGRSLALYVITNLHSSQINAVNEYLKIWGDG